MDGFPRRWLLLGPRAGRRILEDAVPLWPVRREIDRDFGAIKLNRDGTGRGHLRCDAGGADGDAVKVGPFEDPCGMGINAGARVRDHGTEDRGRRRLVLVVGVLVHEQHGLG